MLGCGICGDWTENTEAADVKDLAPGVQRGAYQCGSKTEGRKGSANARPVLTRGWLSLVSSNTILYSIMLLILGIYFPGSSTII